jgi:hypothetical protein
MAGSHGPRHGRKRTGTHERTTNDSDVIIGSARKVRSPLIYFSMDPSIGKAGGGEIRARFAALALD